MTVRLDDGIQVDIGPDRRVVIDGRRTRGAVNVVTHAHTDHLLRRSGVSVCCSAVTAALAAERCGVDWHARSDRTDLELRPSGHIVGSRAVVVDAGTEYLLTGDVSTRDRFYLEGFEPVSADVLVIESTYGRPRYRFPPQAELEAEILDWVDDHPDRPLVCTGYALGRAQKLQALLAGLPRRPVYVDESIAALNAVIERHADVEFGAAVVEPDHVPEPGEVFVLPTGRVGGPLARRFRDQYDARIAGFSGWAAADAFRFGGDYEATFPLSDHADFDELLEIVSAVDPTTVLTHHGFADAFADHVRRELGYEARPLRPKQTTLDEY